MAYFDLGMDSLTTGVSTEGMANYIEDLRLDLLVSTQELLQDVTEIEQAINAGWQGVARDRFLGMFQEQRVKIIEDLKQEFDNLGFRLSELSAQYFNIDEKMIEDQQF